MLNWFKSGAPWIWLTGGAVSVSLIAVLGLLLVIGWRGLTYFWPAPLLQWQTPMEKPWWVNCTLVKVCQLAI